MCDKEHFNYSGDSRIFFEVLLGNKEIGSEEDLKEFQTSYFAMCILLPKKSFTSIVNRLGGLNECKNQSKIEFLSKIFMVDPILVIARIKSLEPKNPQNTNILLLQENTIKNIERVVGISLDEFDCLDEKVQKKLIKLNNKQN